MHSALFQFHTISLLGFIFYTHTPTPTHTTEGLLICWPSLLILFIVCPSPISSDKALFQSLVYRKYLLKYLSHNRCSVNTHKHTHTFIYIMNRFAKIRIPLWKLFFLFFLRLSLNSQLFLPRLPQCYYRHLSRPNFLFTKWKLTDIRRPLLLFLRTHIYIYTLTDNQLLLTWQLL